MITNPIVFTQMEQQLIDNKKNSTNFSSDSWGDDDISGLRERIKTYYLTIQNNKCPYCMQLISSNNGRLWDIEHIIPRANVANFMFEPLNLCVACVDCNGRKSDKRITSSRAQVRYPRNYNQYHIVHPHFDEYDDNILIIRQGYYYVAMESKGEKTIEFCGLNRFYEFSEYNEDVENDGRIQMLSDRLNTTQNDREKRALRNEIASLCINININT